MESSLARRHTIDTIHPVVRKYPITKRKALWVNKEHTAKITGMKKSESDMLLNFLYDHIHRGIDFQTRVKWGKGTVAVYDNRMVQHSVTMDYALGDGAIRHLVRSHLKAKDRPFNETYLFKGDASLRSSVKVSLPGK